MTHPKPAAARDAAKDAPAVAHEPPAQTLPFAPAKPQAAQPLQFTPARTPQPRPQPTAPAAPTPAPNEPATVAKRGRRGGRRFIMLVVIPLVALALGFGWWLNGGRYVGTDNAYVGADKSLITPQVTGPIVAVHVVEGEKVKVGDPLFDIDPKPYETALALAKGRLEAAKIEFANLRSAYASNVDQIK
ncbi:MAG: biotin/lipoyl-binding protein, partial [Hyphomicrobiales bacterium]|nr:biotin/lipoyl-binding protein [Hyphomicrobiales bacterium]